MNLQELDILEHRVADIGKFLARNAGRMTHVDPTSYQAQELRAERSELEAHKRVAEARLAEINAWLQQNFRLFQRRERDKEAPPDPRQATFEMFVADETEKIELQAQRMEAQGNHSQARIWRLELLTVRERVARSHGFA